MAAPRLNGATKWVAGVLAALLIAFVSAAAAHMANGEIHETPAQKRARVRSVIQDELRVELAAIRSELQELRADVRVILKGVR